MSLIRVYSSVKRQILINLKFVSTVHLEKNRIKLYKSTERTEHFGTFLLFGGGGTECEIVECDSEKAAQAEFNSIKESLEKYYSK